MRNHDSSAPRATAAALLLALCSCSLGTASASDATTAPAGVGMGEPAFLVWHDAAATTIAQARLARLSGDWLVQQRDWLAPGEPGRDSVGSAEFRTFDGDDHYRYELYRQAPNGRWYKVIEIDYWRET